MLLRQNHIWGFYSLHLKPFWKNPSSLRDIAISRNYFSWKNTRCGSFLVLLRNIWMISGKNIFGKLLYLWNYLDFSKTVWDVKSKNLKYDFAWILGLKAAHIYTYMVAENTVLCLLFGLKKGCKRFFMAWMSKLRYWGEGGGYLKCIE